MTRRREERYNERVVKAHGEPTKVILTDEQIRAFLRRRYEHQDQWIYLEELANATGSMATGRIDAWAMNLWPSKKLERLAFEIKISRSDFLREIKQPSKRKAGLLASNEFYFVTPSGLLKKEEIPVECGLMEFNAAGEMFVKLAAPWRDTDRPSWLQVAAINRAMQFSTDRRTRAKMEMEYAGREEAIRREHTTLDRRKDDLRAAKDQLTREQMEFRTEKARKA